MKQEELSTLSVNIPTELKDAVAKFAKDNGMKVRGVVINALHRYLLTYGEKHEQ